VIAIDEAQFLPDLLQFCSHAADVDNKQILIAGLDGDFRRQRFGQVGQLSCLTSHPSDFTSLLRHVNEPCTVCVMSGAVLASMF